MIKHWSIIFILLCYSTCDLAVAENEVDAQLTAAARRLVDDVLSRDYKKLIIHAGETCTTDNEPGCEHGLLKPTYEYLYDDSWYNKGRMTPHEHDNDYKSVFSILEKIKSNIKIFIEPFSLVSSTYKTSSQFARVYFYDGNKTKIKLPLSKETRERWMKDFVTCKFVYKNNSEWVVAFTLFESETEGP